MLHICIILICPRMPRSGWPNLRWKSMRYSRSTNPCTLGIAPGSPKIDILPSSARMHKFYWCIPNRSNSCFRFLGGREWTLQVQIFQMRRATWTSQVIEWEWAQCHRRKVVRPLSLHFQQTPRLFSQRCQISYWEWLQNRTRSRRLHSHLKIMLRMRVGQLFGGWSLEGFRT